ncbi:iron export ABC transporter permease subunit FetB [Paenibacillus zeisoli]|uniref:Iron export ABC transporter permease subunit FetB n=1 Tax=Paenibacillus zeisoli TaxID=2496267 RepID=A0A3S1DAA4_9BACL|nr:iron export ABC transporter permease subunit FetB [Paenibacillus zeisoli]RUT36359.1 iron export ABC transporter permease subunit FetB [Paenibacillus zeisoli]
MNGVLQLEWYRLAAAYVFVIILIIMVRIKKIPREREVLLSTVRMTLQLIIVGYVLQYLFTQANAWMTGLIVLLMLAFAIYTLFKRSKHPLNRQLKKLIAISMTSGILASLLFFLLVVIHKTPWYEPSYVIPVAGMLIGNSMTGIALGVNTLAQGMSSRRSWIEGSLMLGAAPKEACREIINQAFDAALLPTINSMVGMGIVFLPGMMTGQILGGASPIVAVEYQIAIMLGILGSVSLSVMVFVQFAYKAYFNDRQQLVLVEEPRQMVK